MEKNRREKVPQSALIFDGKLSSDIGEIRAENLT